MDWYYIKDYCPKSFGKFVNEMFPNLGMPCVSSLSFFDTKRLYKFFDNNGVYLNVEMYNPHQWAFTISLNNGFVLSNGHGSRQTRDEIEMDGFKECFKMLEKKLEMVYE